ncbi:ATP-binding protein [Actinomadura viridis]|uniref:ATP-binding protein n=1 Tax=Actinomadura viridis TaxID=58110 RepID=UPI00367A275A
MSETTPCPAVEQAPVRRSSLAEVVRAVRDLRLSMRAEGVVRPGVSSPGCRAGARFGKRNVPAGDQAPAQVRRWAAGLLMRWGRADVVQDAMTVLTELVTNASQAGAVRVVVVIEPDAGPDVIEVCVWDDAPGVPRMREPDFCAERGRGLFMVDALAVSWGHHRLLHGPGHPGKVVWAALASRAGQQ